MAGDGRCWPTYSSLLPSPGGSSRMCQKGSCERSMPTHHDSSRICCRDQTLEFSEQQISDQRRLSHTVLNRPDVQSFRWVPIMMTKHRVTKTQCDLITVDGIAFQWREIIKACTVRLDETKNNCGTCCPEGHFLVWRTAFPNGLGKAFPNGRWRTAFPTLALIQE